jgi:hypothetical protein
MILKLHELALMDLVVVYLFKCVYTDINIVNKHITCVISGFRSDVDGICAFLGYYASLSGSSVPTFRDNLSVPSLRFKKSKKIFLTLEDGTDRLSRNVGTELPLDDA